MALPASAPKIGQELAALRDPDPTLEGLVRHAKDLRRILGSTFTTVSDATDFAGHQRALDQRIYRYYEAGDLWISDSRAVFQFGLSGPVVVPGSNFLHTAGNVVPAGVAEGFDIPQDAVPIRWAWRWTNGSTTGDQLVLQRGATPAHIVLHAAASTRYFEELLPVGGLTYTAPTNLRLNYIAVGGSTVADVVAWVEFGWLRSFAA
jgi:hypothetical protein